MQWIAGTDISKMVRRIIESIWNYVFCCYVRVRRPSMTLKAISGVRSLYKSNIVEIWHPVALSWFSECGDSKFGCRNSTAGLLKVTCAIQVLISSKRYETAVHNGQLIENGMCTTKQCMHYTC